MDSCQVQADCITQCRAQQKAAKPIIEGCSETIGILCHKARIQGLIAKKQPEIQVFIKCTGEVLRMRQTAVVVSKNGKIAEIRVERASMCDGCTHKNCESHTCAAGSLMGAGKTLVTRAYNEADANVGDTVAVETATKKILSYAALVFLLPILFCAVFYAVGNAIFHTAAGAYGTAAAGFVLSFCIIAMVERQVERKKPDIVICAVLQQAPNEQPDKETQE